MSGRRPSLQAELHAMAAGARFGAPRRFSPGAYRQLPDEEARLLVCALDFGEQTLGVEPVFGDIRAAAYQAYLQAYAQARALDPAAAEAFYRSLSEDYPGATDSALVHAWGELASASQAFREVAEDPARMSWQKTEALFRATSEFLAGLLPFLVTLRRAALGLEPQGAASFELGFAALLADYRDLLPDEPGPLALFARLAEPEVIEALEQGRAQPDAEAGALCYSLAEADAPERRLALGDLFLIAAAGSHLQHAYLAAISAIAVMESGSPAAQALFPPELWP